MEYVFEIIQKHSNRLFEHFYMIRSQVVLNIIYDENKVVSVNYSKKKKINVWNPLRTSNGMYSDYVLNQWTKKN